MKVKELSFGRGRKYSNNYQSVDYHVGITVEGEEAPDKLKNYANAILLEMESHEDIRCKLIIEGIKAEQIAEFKKTYNNVTKKIAKDEQFNEETLEVEIKKKVKKLPKGTKKINTSKVYNYKFANGKARTCNKCHEFLSFDDYDKETHPYGTHVDEEGHIIGDGNCELYDGGV